MNNKLKAVLFRFLRGLAAAVLTGALLSAKDYFGGQPIFQPYMTIIIAPLITGIILAIDKYIRFEK